MQSDVQYVTGNNQKHKTHDWLNLQSDRGSEHSGPTVLWGSQEPS